MEQRDNLLIAVDAGHGGWDNGAQYQGRLEKDDNLRLALEVQKALKNQGVDVLMTRDTDVFVELRDRAKMANDADADLFISLHRNSYTEQTPMTNGVENWIYLTAPEETAGRAAELVLSEVVNVGVQSNHGVRRGNYYVVRRTTMPSMLLEMGYIINEEDNRLFDEKLVQYAEAIARGALQFFNVPWQGIVPPSAPPPPPSSSALPPSPVGALPNPSQGQGRASENVKLAQTALNQSFNSGLAVDGIYGPLTRRAVVSAFQQAVNDSCGTILAVDGNFGADTIAALPSLAEGDKGNAVKLLQILLLIHGYPVGEIDGVFGPITKSAVQMFQRDNYLAPDGVAGAETLRRLFANWGLGNGN